MLNRENIHQVVLFDLDDTLLKTKELMRAILTRLENVYGLENDALANSYKDFRLSQKVSNQAFSPQNLIDYWYELFFVKSVHDGEFNQEASSNPINNQQHPTKQQFQTNFFDIFDQEASRQLFEDAKQAIESLREFFYLGIFSEGVVFWQLLKYTQALQDYGEAFPANFIFTHLDKTQSDFLDHVFKRLFNLGIRKAVFIDNKKTKLRSIHSWHKNSDYAGKIEVELFWINRNEEKELRDAQSGDENLFKSLTSLSDFSRYTKNI